jgi:hypothetical protein
MFQAVDDVVILQKLFPEFEIDRVLVKSDISKVRFIIDRVRQTIENHITEPYNNVDSITDYFLPRDVNKLRTDLNIVDVEYEEIDEVSITSIKINI